MWIKFNKMHGLGNDFMVVDLITQHAYLTPMQIRHLADRNFGVGFDQLLLVEVPEFSCITETFSIGLLSLLLTIPLMIASWAVKAIVLNKNRISTNDFKLRIYFFLKKVACMVFELPTLSDTVTFN